MKFLIQLKQKQLYPDVKRYFEKRGVRIIFQDELIPEVIIVETDKIKQELNEIMYVFCVKEIRNNVLLNLK